MAGFLSQQQNTEHLRAEANSVFSNSSLPHNISDIHVLFKNLNQTYKQHLRSWWEIASLDTYILQQIVYRGLRIPLSPKTYSDDHEFVKGWEKILTESSIKRMTFLSEYEKQTFVKINQKLEQEIKEVQNFSTHPEFAQLEQRLQKNFEILKSEIKERKQRKYLRDRTDFDQDKVYQWRNKIQPTWNRTQTDRTLNTDISESE